MKERNYGIDVFKMFAMYLVCVLHVLGQGGVIVATEPLSANYAFSWSLELIAYVAVNCFALASGYVGINAKFRPNKLINLWLATVFYGVIITLVFPLTGAVNVGFDDYKLALSPFLSGNYGSGYWYFTAYAVTFMLMPFYNYVLTTLDKKKLAYLILILVILFSVIPAIKQVDYFLTKNGYSYVWISVLYLIGGYIRKFKPFETVKTRTIVLLCVITYSIVCVGHYALNWYIVTHKHEDISRQADVLSTMIGKDSNFIKPGLFANYTFPTTLIAAVLLLLLFSRIRIKKELFKARLTSYMPLVFFVYIIHTNHLVFENVLAGLFEGYAKLNPVLLVIAVLGTALAIFVICIMIDMLRFELFKLIKVDKLCVFIENKLRAFWNGIFEKKESEVD